MTKYNDKMIAKLAAKMKVVFGAELREYSKAANEAEEALFRKIEEVVGDEKRFEDEKMQISICDNDINLDTVVRYDGVVVFEHVMGTTFTFKKGEWVEYLLEL